MDDDVALSALASCGTHRIRAKCFRWVHWLWCTVLHKHILPWTLDFFNSLPLHRLVGSYRSFRLTNKIPKVVKGASHAMHLLHLLLLSVFSLALHCHRQLDQTLFG